MSTLYLKNLVKAYGKKKVVTGINLSIKQGEIVGLLGPNGAGKTTTFYMTIGMVKPSSGKIFFDDEDITNLPIFKKARKGISYLPQESSVFKKLTVEENIIAILEIIYKKKQIKERCYKLLDELKIKHLAKEKAFVLSGGERRRLEIARILASNPAFMLLDEPFAGIDPISIKDIQNIIKELAQKNIGVLISDHNVRETLGVCDKAYIVSNGSVLESGSPEKIINSEMSKKTYLGDNFKL